MKKLIKRHVIGFQSFTDLISSFVIVIILKIHNVFQVQDATLTQDMRQAAFRAFASLGANDEDIRKRIIDTESLMEQVVSGLQDPGGSRVRLAAVRCLHSLSRSVQQLRTTFQDHAVWRPLMQLLHGADKGLEGKI